MSDTMWCPDCPDESLYADPKCKTCGGSGVMPRPNVIDGTTISSDEIVSGTITTDSIHEFSIPSFSDEEIDLDMEKRADEYRESLNEPDVIELDDLDRFLEWLDTSPYVITRSTADGVIEVPDMGEVLKAYLRGDVSEPDTSFGSIKSHEMCGCGHKGERHYSRHTAGGHCSVSGCPCKRARFDG